jgi:hypothetical protein
MWARSPLPPSVSESVPPTQFDLLREDDSETIVVADEPTGEAGSDEPPI